MYNCYKENIHVVGLKWDIYMILANCLCVPWGGAKVCLKESQEKSKIVLKISEIYDRFQGFKSEFD